MMSLNSLFRLRPRRAGFRLGICLGSLFLATGLVGPLHAQTNFGYTGSTQSYVVPAGVYAVKIKAWGAGGGASANVSGSYGAGGGAGYAEADVAVTPGETLTISIGRGGAGWNSTEGFAGGAWPNGGIATNFGGGGGGRTQVSKSGLLLVAAGGGGGGYQFSTNAGRGGVGGASTGETGGSSFNNQGGQGASQSGGGAGGYGTASYGNSGGSYSGGQANGANIPGGAGGDGYFGGGGGGGGLTGYGDSGGGGGGGSSHVSGASASNAVTYSGSGTSPGNASDSSRPTSGQSAMGNYGAGVGATTSGYRGGNGYVSITTLVAPPVILSPTSLTVNEGQWVSQSVSASGSPTTYGATGLPAGLSINTGNGAITGTLSSNGGAVTGNVSLNSTLSVSNTSGSDTENLAWTITGAVITPQASVSPTSLDPGQAVTLERLGSSNFGFGWTQGTIWTPGGAGIGLGNLPLGTQSYTPVNGPGVYSYQFRLVDEYYNFKDQWLTFTVNHVAAPTGLAAPSVYSTSVGLTWAAVSGAAQYQIWVNGSLNSTVSSANATVTGLSPGQSYSFYVVALDGSGNPSNPSTTRSEITARGLAVFTPTG